MPKPLIIGGAALATALVLSPVLGWAFRSGGHGPWMMGGWMWYMLVFMVAFWGLVIWAVVALVRGLSSPRGSNGTSDHSGMGLEILKQRYARGEIDKQEYEEKKRGLT